MIFRPYAVVLGADSIKEQEPAMQEFGVLQSFPHPDYDDLTNDIMLLKVGYTPFCFKFIMKLNILKI